MAGFLSRDGFKRRNSYGFLGKSRDLSFCIERCKGYRQSDDPARFPICMSQRVSAQVVYNGGQMIIEQGDSLTHILYRCKVGFHLLK